MKAISDKIPFITDAVKSFGKTLVISLASVVAFILLLMVTGVYEKLEAALDLKHTSPIITVPMWVMVGACAVCVFVGLIMYFHKYKRNKSKTSFGEAIAPAFNQNNGKNA